MAFLPEFERAGVPDQSGRLVFKADSVAPGLVLIGMGLTVMSCGVFLIFDTFAPVQMMDWLLPSIFVFGGLACMAMGFFVTTRRRQLLVDQQQREVLVRRGMRLRQEQRYGWNEVQLTVHPSLETNPRGFDWRGFVLTFDLPRQNFPIARSKKLERLTAAAERLSAEVGIPWHQSDVEVHSPGIALTVLLPW